MPSDPTPPRGDDDPAAAPDFGPRGYLPQRAAHRARKIVLREQMSLGWPLAALAAGLVVLVAGAVFWLRGGGAPGEPFEPVVALPTLDVGDARVVSAEGADVLVVRASGALRAFHAPDQPVRWCAESARLEGGEAAVWRLDGRAVGGGADSLRPVPLKVHDDVVHAAPGMARSPMRPADRGEQPVCADDGA